MKAVDDGTHHRRAVHRDKEYILCGSQTTFIRLPDEPDFEQAEQLYM